MAGAAFSAVFVTAVFLAVAFFAGAALVAGVALAGADFVAVALLAVALFAVALFAVALFAVALFAVAFFAVAFFAVVALAGADFFADVAAAAVLATVFFAGGLLAASLLTVVRLATAFFAGALLAIAPVVVARLAGAFAGCLARSIGEGAGSASERALAAAARNVSAAFAGTTESDSVTRSRIVRAPLTTSDNSLPGRNSGTFSPAPRTVRSNAPKPLMTTFSPVAMLRVMMSTTESNAWVATCRLPSNRFASSSMSSFLFIAPPKS